MLSQTSTLHKLMDKEGVPKCNGMGMPILARAAKDAKPGLFLLRGHNDILQRDDHGKSTIGFTLRKQNGTKLDSAHNVLDQMAA